MTYLDLNLIFNFEKSQFKSNFILIMSEFKKENYSYNRIIVIGNGFDLALGLPTSYKLFLLDYLKIIIKNKIKDNSYNSSLLIISKISFERGAEIDSVFSKINSIEELFSFCRSRLNMKSINSNFLDFMISKIKKVNWVDLESLYFELLIEEIDNLKKSRVLERDYSAIIDLNNVFDEICTGLNNYIKNIEENMSINSLVSPMKDLFDECNGNQVHNINLKGEFIPDKLLFLNFNYTSSLSKFVYPKFYEKASIIHIHGQIFSKENPVVFGYGDDTHRYYREIESEDSFDPLRFIKSFHYPKTNNYHNFLNFIAANKYEVFIVGHSCGLSDRTLLKTLFEDKNCLAIKIFHRGNIEEHFYKNIAISKHFEDKAELRRKILSFDKYALIPQSTN